MAVSMALFVVASAVTVPVASAVDAEAQPTILITGTNRGIGYAFAEYYAKEGWKVLATARRPEKADALQALAAKHSNLLIERLDVTDHPAIDALAEKYRDMPIDVLINNAAMLGDPGQQSFGDLNNELFEQVMAVNVYGPLYVVEAFAGHVESSDQKKIVTLTSAMGSLSLTGENFGKFYFYRISKAGVNMAMRTLRADLKPRGVVVALLSPGMVGTDMLEKSGYRGPSLTPTESVAGMVAIIAELTIEDPGTVTSHDRGSLPW